MRKDRNDPPQPVDMRRAGRPDAVRGIVLDEKAARPLPHRDAVADAFGGLDGEMRAGQRHEPRPHGFVGAETAARQHDAAPCDDLLLTAAARHDHAGHRAIGGQQPDRRGRMP